MTCLTFGKQNSTLVNGIKRSSVKQNSKGCIIGRSFHARGAGGTGVGCTGRGGAGLQAGPERTGAEVESRIPVTAGRSASSRGVGGSRRRRSRQEGRGGRYCEHSQGHQHCGGRPSAPQRPQGGTHPPGPPPGTHFTPSKKQNLSESSKSRSRRGGVYLTCYSCTGGSGLPEQDLRYKPPETFLHHHTEMTDYHSCVWHTSISIFAQQ